MMRLMVKMILLTGIAILIMSGSSSAGMTLIRGVVSSGGVAAANSTNGIKGTAGCYASYHEGIGWPKVQTGYWNLYMQGAGCDCTPGDADANGEINILDIIYLIDYKFKEGPEPIPFAICSGDADGNCTVNILDVILLIDYKFKTGPSPGNCIKWTSTCGNY